jgi:hypothetical protein
MLLHPHSVLKLQNVPVDLVNHLYQRRPALVLADSSIAATRYSNRLKMKCSGGWDSRFSFASLTCNAMRLDEWMAVFGSDTEEETKEQEEEDDVLISVAMSRKSTASTQPLGDEPSNAPSSVNLNQLSGSVQAEPQFSGSVQTGPQFSGSVQTEPQSSGSVQTWPQFLGSVQTEPQSSGSVQTGPQLSGSVHTAPQFSGSVQTGPQEAEVEDHGCDPNICRMSSGICVDCTKCSHHCECGGREPQDSDSPRTVVLEAPQVCDPSTCRQLICGDCSRCTEHCVCEWESTERSLQDKLESAWVDDAASLQSELKLKAMQNRIQGSIECGSRHSLSTLSKVS